MSLQDHQNLVKDKIMDFLKSMNKDEEGEQIAHMIEGLRNLGETQFWEEIDNDQQALGAIKLLGWLQTYLET